MSEEVGSLLPSAAALGVVALVALLLTVSRGWADGNRGHIRSAVYVALATILAQGAHFAEELTAGFNVRFPALFGRGSISLRVFVLFNLVWLVIWCLCAWGLAARRRAALFPLWFLAIACVVNGVAHPLLSVFAGGYFPGVVTSPVVGILGVLLLRRLLLVTNDSSASRAAA